MNIKKSEYRKKFKEEYNLAKHILSDQGIIEWSEHDYQIFTFKNEDVTLVFYPHRTSAWNYHVRVRNQGSKNKKEADRIMMELDAKSGYNCTFSRKATP